VSSVNYDYDEGDHQRWKVAAAHKGQTLKEWIRRALNEVADRDIDEANRRRGR
jgi:predicted HicB family RNase H-like nuclease